MGRTAVAIGTPDRRPRVMDRLVSGLLFTDEEPDGDSADGTARIRALLPGATSSEAAGICKNEAAGEADVILARLWFELSLPERERFGHCFSSLVLKALGLRVCPRQEMET